MRFRTRRFRVVSIGLAICLGLALKFASMRPVTFRGHTGIVQKVVASPDGNLLASCSDEDGTIRVWDVANGTERAVLHDRMCVKPKRELDALPGSFNCSGSVAISHDGRTLASNMLGGRTIKLWDVEEGRLRAILRGHGGVLSSIAFSPDGTILASADNDQSVRLWDVATGEEKVAYPQEPRAYRILFSPDGLTLAMARNGLDPVGVRASTIALWDIATGKTRITLPDNGGVVSLAFTPDGKTLAAGDWWGAATLWDTASGAVTATLESRFQESLDCLAFSPDGKTLAAMNYWGDIEFWDVADGHRHRRTWLFPTIRHAALFTSIAHRAADHFDDPTSIFFTPDGRLMAVGTNSRDPTAVKLWRAADILNPDNAHSPIFTR